MTPGQALLRQRCAAFAASARMFVASVTMVRALDHPSEHVTGKE